MLGTFTTLALCQNYRKRVASKESRNRGMSQLPAEIDAYVPQKRVSPSGAHRNRIHENYVFTPTNETHEKESQHKWELKLRNNWFFMIKSCRGNIGLQKNYTAHKMIREIQDARTKMLARQETLRNEQPFEIYHLEVRNNTRIKILADE